MPTIQDGRNAIDQGNLQQARLIFQAILQETPRNEEAWLGLAEVVTEPDDKRVCYENVLKIDKNNRKAKEGLRSLEPKANPLVAALGGRTFPGEEEEEDEFVEEDEDVPTEAGQNFYVEEETETPTPVLIAIGLALSVVVFAVFGGLIFYTLTNLTAP